MTTLPELFAAAARRWPGRTALEDDQGSLSYAEALERARGLAGRLRAEGLGAGDPVYLALNASREFLVAYWGVQLAGGLAVPVNHRLGAPDQEAIFARAPAAPALVAAALADHLAPGLAGREREPLLVAGLDDLPPGPGETVPPPAPGDPALVLHTSGTTGRPKGALVSHADLAANLRVSLAAHGFRTEDRILLALPVYHCTAAYTLLPAAAWLGAALVAVAPAPGPVAQALAERGISCFPAVPTLLEMTAAALGGRPAPRLKWIAYAGSPLPARALAGLRRAFPGVELRNFFGLTETVVPTHLLPDAEVERRPGSIGLLLPEVRAALLDETGRPLPSGREGELAIHRDLVVSGYWGEPERLRTSLAGEWFRTGDLARVDSEGYWYLSGRRKEMIIVGGENVYAPAVEAVLLEHPAVREAAVLGVPATGVRRSLGELVKAVVVAEPGAALTAADIRRFAQERGLATYQVPQLVEFRETLPRSEMGKVLKEELM